MKKILLCIMLITFFLNTLCYANDSIVINDDFKTNSLQGWSFLTSPSNATDVFYGTGSRYLSLAQGSSAVHHNFLDKNGDVSAFFGTTDIYIIFSLKGLSDSNRVIKFGETEGSLVGVSLTIDSNGRLYYEKGDSFASRVLVSDTFKFSENTLYNMHLKVNTGNTAASVIGNRSTYDIYINNILINENVPFANLSGGITYGSFEQIGSGNFNIYYVSYSDNVNGWGAVDLTDYITSDSNWSLTTGALIVTDSSEGGALIANCSNAMPQTVLNCRREIDAIGGIVRIETEFSFDSSNGFALISVNNDQMCYIRLKIDCSNGNISYFNGTEYVSSNVSADTKGMNTLVIYATPASVKACDAYINGAAISESGVTKISIINVIRQITFSICENASINISNLKVMSVESRDIVCNSSEVKSVSDGESVENTEYTAECSLINHSKADKSVLCIVAEYREGVLMNINLNEENIKAGESKDISVNIITPSETDDYNAKFFIIEKLSLKPLANSIEF